MNILKKNLLSTICFSAISMHAMITKERVQQKPVQQVESLSQFLFDKAEFFERFLACETREQALKEFQNFKEYILSNYKSGQGRLRMYIELYRSFEERYPLITEIDKDPLCNYPQGHHYIINKLLENIASIFFHLGNPIIFNAQNFSKMIDYYQLFISPKFAKELFVRVVRRFHVFQSIATGTDAFRCLVELFLPYHYDSSSEFNMFVALACDAHREAGIQIDILLVLEQILHYRIPDAAHYYMELAREMIELNQNQYGPDEDDDEEILSNDPILIGSQFHRTQQNVRLRDDSH